LGDAETTILPQMAIATSSAQNDSGMFELNFRDERYLPFEGAGAISTWQLELPQAIRQVDYDSITDVLLHLSYTAREGEAIFKQAVNTQLITTLESATLARLFSLRHEFSTLWNRLLFPAEGQDQVITLSLGKQHFPRYLNYAWPDTGQTEIRLSITSGKLYLDPQGLLPDTADIEAIWINGKTSAPDADSGLPAFDLVVTGKIANDKGIDVTLTVTDGELRAEDWKDMYVLLNYGVET
jgi:hypothetical protein